MKFCSNCGKEVSKESKFCANCGKEISTEEVTSVTEVSKEDVENQNQVVKQSNPLAITGFVISLVSLLCCGGTAWLSLIFSIIGLIESKKKNNAGKGLAIAGIVISTILLVLLFICYVLLFSTSLSDLLKNPGYYY